MDPLSVTASITTILTAAAQVSNLLSQVQNAPASMTAISAEVEHIEIVFRALKNFVDRARAVSRPRAALLQIEDVATILTRTVLVFGELQTLMASFSPHRQIMLSTRLRWARSESGIRRLVDQLQQHKTSLSLLLQVIQW